MKITFNSIIECKTSKIGLNGKVIGQMEDEMELLEWVEFIKKEMNSPDTKYGNITIPNFKPHSWFNLLVKPNSDESLLSWIIRQAWKLEKTPKEFILAEKNYWNDRQFLKYYKFN